MTKKQKQTFAMHDERKDKLFDALRILTAQNRKALGITDQNNVVYFDQFYRGMATATMLGSKNMVLKLENKDSIQPVTSCHQVKEQLLVGQDNLGLEVGFLHGKWWIMEVFTIATLVGQNRGHTEGLLHFSVNSALNPQ